MVRRPASIPTPLAQDANNIVWDASAVFIRGHIHIELKQQARLNGHYQNCASMCVTVVVELDPTSGE